MARCMTMQRHEVLPVSEARGQLVRRMYRQGGLADPGHPANRDDLHYAAPGGLCDVIGQPRQLRCPAGERCNITRQCPRRHRREPAWRYHFVAASCGFRFRQAAGGVVERSPLRPYQTQRVGQQPGGMAAWQRAYPAFQVTDRSRADPRRITKLILRQPGFSTQPPQQRPEARHLTLRHAPTTLTDPAPRTSPVNTQPRAEQSYEFEPKYRHYGKTAAPIRKRGFGVIGQSSSRDLVLLPGSARRIPAATAHVAGRNCIGPCAPALLGPAIRQKSVSTKLIAAR